MSRIDGPEKTLDSTFLDDLSCYSMASTWEACDGEFHEKNTP